MGKAARPTLAGRAEYGFTIFALLVVIGGMDPIFYDIFGSRSQDFGEVNSTRLVTSTAIYMVAIALLLMRLQIAQKIMWRNLVLLPVFLLPLISVFWSVDPRITSFRASAYLLTCAFSIYLVSSMSAEEFMRRLMIAIFIGGVASLIYAAVMPGVAIHHGGSLDGNWKGVYGQKNELGRIAALGVIVAIFCVPLNPAQKWMRWATIGIYMFLLIMSQSKTNWLILASMIGFIPLTRWLRNDGVAPSLRVATVVILATGLTILVLTQSSNILAAIGRDDSFSGRQTLWQGVSAVTEQKYPVTGAGYGAFFTDRGGIWDVKSYLRHWNSLPNHAHSGYLNTRAEMGYPGLIVLSLFILCLAWRLVSRMIHDSKRIVWAGYGALFFLFLVNNFSESVAFRHSDIAWIMVLTAFAHAIPPKRVTAVRRKRPMGLPPLPPRATNL